MWLMRLLQLDETKRLHSMQMEELEKRTSQLQMEADGLLKAQQALYVTLLWWIHSAHNFNAIHIEAGVLLNVQQFCLS